MSTVIRPEVSKKNEYYIDRHRFYELKHYCMQYKSWKKDLDAINLYPAIALDRISYQTDTVDSVLRLVEAREYYTNRIYILKEIAVKADPIIGPCVLEGIITNTSYEKLKTRIDIPCCKDIYYTVYRKFFWLLDKVRK